MGKKSNPLVIVLIIIAGIFLASKLGYLPFALVQEEYVPYYSYAANGQVWQDKFSLEAQGQPNPVTFEVIGGEHYICAVGDNGAQGEPRKSVLTSTRDFFNSDLILYVYGESLCSGNPAECKLNSNVFINNIQLFQEEYCLRPGDCGSFYNHMQGAHVLEIHSSKINGNIIQVKKDGMPFGDYDLSQSDNPNHLFVKLYSAPEPGGLFRQTWSCAKDMGFKPEFSCQKGPNDILGFQSFAGGSPVSSQLLRFAPKSYCRALPVIITKGSGSGFNEELLTPLSEGQTLTVPSDETWSVFYLFENDGSLPVMCEDSYYDFAHDRCTNISGIVTLCSEGQFDPLEGACVVQPESHIVCERGYYDTNLELCVWQPPMQPFCADPSYTYNSQTERCEKSISGTPVCERGEYNAQYDACYYTPSEAYVCDEGFTYVESIGVCGKVAEHTIMCDGQYDENSSICYTFALEGQEQACDAVDGNYNMSTHLCTLAVERNVTRIINGPGNIIYKAPHSELERFVNSLPWWGLLLIGALVAFVLVKLFQYLSRR